LLPRDLRDVIDAATITDAAAVIIWRLREIRRLLFNLDAPTGLVTAMRFHHWPTAEARRNSDHRLPT